MPKFKSRGNKNFGYGRQLHFAGTNALRTCMPGHFQTIANHSDRWKLFCQWAKAMNIREAHQINNHTLKLYADYLRTRLQGEGKPLAITTAQNRLSTCNVVMKCLRGNRQIYISPVSALEAHRKTVRTTPPILSQTALSSAQAELTAKGKPHIAAILGLCRELGLRVREAALLDSNKALEQALKNNEVSIVRGTKGGRSKSTPTSPSSVERLIPTSPQIIEALKLASQQQGNRDNLIPEGKNLVRVIALIRQHSRLPLQRVGIKNRHELRAAYACERYQQLANRPAPVFTGGRTIPKEEDLRVRTIIGHELGHSRDDVLRAYVGTSKAQSSSRQADTSEPDHQIGKE